tara:strand:- start:142 stop:498 length:357 start_codon:yes stop_codon:yes gene_type:complete
MQICFLDLDEHYVQHLCHEPTKLCRKCNKHFGAKDLNKDRKKPDGLNNICLKCHQSNMEKRRLRNKKSRVNCKDWYIVNLMNQKLPFKIEPTKELIEQKKLHLKLTRKLNQLSERDKL